MITTPRLRLIPSSPALGRSEIRDREAFSELLGAVIPDNWPPDSLADALEFFLDLMEATPSWHGWLAWYAVAEIEQVPVLIGSVGFKGPPSSDGTVEIGYSVLPQDEGRGYATEMVGALVAWARDTGKVKTVLAQTTEENIGSRRVLSKLGFISVGPGEDPSSTLYRLSFHPIGGRDPA